MTSSQKALALLGPLRTHKVGLMIFIDQTDVKVLLKMLQICYNFKKVPWHEVTTQEWVIGLRIS